MGLRRTLGLGKVEGRTFSDVRKLVIRWEEIKDEEEIEANCYAINKRDTFVNSNELEFLRHENEELKKSLSEGQYMKHCVRCGRKWHISREYRVNIRGPLNYYGPR